MMRAKRWSVEIYIDENEGRTYAEARLRGESETTVTGRGRAKLNPADEDIPEIGDELAVARALSDLGNRLLLTAAADISQIRNEQVRLTR